MKRLGFKEVNQTFLLSNKNYNFKQILFNIIFLSFVIINYIKIKIKNDKNRNFRNYWLKYLLDWWIY